MTLGQLTAFQSYIFSIGFALGTTSANIAKAIEGLGASGRILYLLYRTPLIPAPTPRKDASGTEAAVNEDDTFAPTLPPQKPESMEGVVEFHNVNFEYPTRTNVPVLRDFTLTIPANTTAALVGSSGSGKSTVVALLQRFYEVSGGSIRVDGIDIRNLDLKWLRNHIGYVQQEPQLFGMTVRQNVMYGVNRDVTQEEIEQACRNANAHDFVADWPNGYDTLVGERGVKLSGGQKQRLAIARALLTNCRILLLDEATSALDAESEHLVQEAIDKAVEGRTVLIVAHRLSTIRRASQIVVMDQHRIVDVGTHDELLARCSRYVDLIKRQQGNAQ
jgi:ATP-binding cassette, subfamily B (MDR/TAP), member 10